MTITGGNGGTGGNAAAGGTSYQGGGGGGGGGAGVVLNAASFSNSGTITGGNGGNGGIGAGPQFSAPIDNGTGGTGGTGLDVTFSSGATITNSGTIQGGAGGTGTAPQGAAGSGIAGQNLSIINSGAIIAGTNAAAIRLTGGTNTLALLGATSGLTGNIAILAGTLNLNQATDMTLANVITGAGALIKSGIGTMTLSGSSTYSGGTTLSGGVLAVSANAQLGSAGGSLTFDGGALRTTGTFSASRAVSLLQSGAIEVTGAADRLTLSGLVTGTGGLVKSGAGTLTLTAANSYTGATILNGGTLALTGAGSLATSSGVEVNAGLDISGITAGGTTVAGLSGSNAGTIALGAKVLTVDQAGASTYAGTLSGTGGLIKSGAGTLTLTAANSYTGATILNGGTLALTGAGSLATSSSVEVNAGLDISGMTAGGTTVAGLSGSNAGAIALGAKALTVDQAGASIYAGTLSGTGSLIKSGAGTLTLTAASSYTGATILNGGTLALTGAGSLATSSGVEVNAGLDISGITAGGTTVAGLSGSNAGTIALGAKVLTVDQAGASTYAGTLSGTGGLIKSGAGTLTLTAANSYTGATILNGGTLALTGAGSLATSSGVEVNAGLDISGMTAGGTTLTRLFGSSTGNINLGSKVLTVNQTDETVYAGKLSGTGGFVFNGNGFVRLTGDSSAFNGTSNIAGAVSVDGQLGGALNVLSGGTLKGNGTVGSVALASGATIAPGNSIGALTVAGDLRFAPGSTYQVEVASNGASDRINVTGTAALNGAGVTLSSLDPTVSYRNGQTFTILTAGTVSGQFSPTVTLTSAFLTPTLTYVGNEVLINLMAATSPGAGLSAKRPLFSTVARSRNEAQTATALDVLSQTAGSSSLALYNAVLFLGADDARTAFNQLSGEGHASVKSALVGESRHTRGAIGARLQSAFGSDDLAPVAEGDSPAIDYGMGVTGWGDAYGSWGKTDGDGNAATLDHDTGGFFVGLDGAITDAVRLGLMAGYSASDLDIANRAFSADVDSYTVGLYAGTEIAGIGLRGGLTHSWHTIETARSVKFAGFRDALSADYNARTTQVFGEVGYKLYTAGAMFEPFAGLDYVSLNTDDFSETGGAAALTMNDNQTETTFSTIGLRASAGFTLGTMTARAKGSLAWQHAFGDDLPSATMAFAGGEKFSVQGVPIAGDAALVRLGFDVDLMENATIGLSYGGQFGDGTQENSARLDLSVRF